MMGGELTYREEQEHDNEGTHYSFLNIHPLETLFTVAFPDFPRRASEVSGAGKTYIRKIRVGKLDIEQHVTFAPDDDAIPWLTVYRVGETMYTDEVEAWQALTHYREFTFCV